MMMQLFRWLRSPNNEKPLADPPADPPTDPKEPIEEFLKDSKSSNSPPPSYEDSQHVSIRTVLQGARKAAPLLWPSALCPSPPSSVATPRHEYASAYRFTEATGGKPGGEKKGGGVMKAVASAEEIAMLEVLARLAMAQCGDHTFLDAMRRFSDAYFAPTTAPAPATATRREAAVMVAAARLRERQRRALDAVGAPRDSATLVLCGRVLEAYYAGLGHVDPMIMTTATTITTAASTPTSRRRPETDRKGGAPLPRAGTVTETGTGTGTGTGMKTRLSQIAGCEEPGCVCADFDMAPHPHPHPHPRPHSQPTSTTPAYTCACGHARASHTLFRAGLARLLRRYTNWDPRPYAALGHRSPRGRRKHGPREIRACGADHDPDHGRGGEEGKDRRRCPCRDYDHCASSSSSGGGSCARCGHDSVAHIPPDAAAREMPPRQGRAEDRDGDGDGGQLAGASRSGSGSGSGSGGLAHNRCRWAEWDLSWILVENAFLLLSRQIAPSSSLECSGSI